MSRWLRLISLVLSLALMLQVSAEAAPAHAVAAPTVTKVLENGALRVDTVSDKGGKSVHVVSFLEGTLQTPNKQPKASSGKEIALKPLTDEKSVGRLDQTLEAAQIQKPTGRLYFQVFGTQEEALSFANSILKDGKISPTWRRSFAFGSYVETYGRWYNGGYHVRLSSRDAQYLFGLGGAAGGTLIAWLSAVGALSGGVAVILGGVLAIALLTVYWLEQNSDGSMEFQVPYSSLLLPMGSRPIKVGRHWYAF